MTSIQQLEAQESVLSRLLNWASRRAPDDASTQERHTDGQLIYAVGDIHGRRDLLDQLMEKISMDVVLKGREHATLVFLGDYVDRGPESKGVIDTMLALEQLDDFDLICLKGNHEQVMSRFLDDFGIGPVWMTHGGRDTLLSYDIEPPREGASDEVWEKTQAALNEALPPRHRQFLDKLVLSHSVGGYFFAHAGVRPGVALNSQEENDLLWIRREFISHKKAFPKIVVHGHTVTDTLHLNHSRIGVDTGAYATGRLSAARLENAEIEFITTE